MKVMSEGDLRCSRMARSRVLSAMLAMAIASPLSSRAQAARDRAPESPSAEPGAITGRVHDPAGRPLAEVRVTLEVLAPAATTVASPRRVDTTTAEGQFVFANVPAGSYALTFERDS